MTNQVKVAWHGREYEAIRKNAADSGEAAAVWQLLHDGALLTSFPADPADGPGDVQEKVIGWLEANRSRPAADVGRQ